MKKILILGGTKFFGKRLVQKLEEEGAELTIATRGKSDISFAKNTEHIKVDRFDAASMETAFAGTSWDVIYDQICFSPRDAEAAVNVFAGRVKRYVFTSTLSVYEMNEEGEKKEEAFDPYKYSLKDGSKEDFDYAEGKRQAEAVFFQKADFPVVAVRPPIVLGEDDYTERLHDHVRKILNKEKIKIDDLNVLLSFVDSNDLAAFLLWSGKQQFTGPVNASSPDQITLKEMIQAIETETNTKADITASSGAWSSPMNFPVSFYQNTERAAALGYQFQPLERWFQPLVSTLVKQESVK